MVKDELKFAFEESSFNFSTDDLVDHCFKRDDNSFPLFYNLLSFGELINDSNINVNK